MYVREDVERAMALIASGAVPAERLVTAEFALGEAPEAFRVAASGEAIKVHLHPQADCDLVDVLPRDPPGQRQTAACRRTANT